MLALIAATLALATETPAPAPMTLTIPAIGGVTLVAREGGCDFTVVGTVPARKVGELAEALAVAKTQCLAAQGQVAAAAARAPAEAALLVSAGGSMLIGNNVRVRTPEGLLVEGGEFLSWEAYGEAVTSGNSMMFAPVMPTGRDPNLYRLSGGSMGAFGTTPPVPGQVVTVPAPASAACGTAAECQKAVVALSNVLAGR